MPGLQVAHRTVYSVHWQPLVTSGHHSKVPGTLAWPGLVTQATVTTNLDTGHEPLQAASYPLTPGSQHLAHSTWHLAPNLPAPSRWCMWRVCVQVTGSWTAAAAGGGQAA